MLRIKAEKSWCSVRQIQCTATVSLPYSSAVSKFVLNAKVVRSKFYDSILYSAYFFVARCLNPIIIYAHIMLPVDRYDK